MGLVLCRSPRVSVGDTNGVIRVAMTPVGGLPRILRIGGKCLSRGS